QAEEGRSGAARLRPRRRDRSDLFQRPGAPGIRPGRPGFVRPPQGRRGARLTELRASDSIQPLDVIAFWQEAGPDRWFTKDEAFDAVIAERFLAVYEAAAARRRTHWAATAA